MILLRDRSIGFKVTLAPALAMLFLIAVGVIGLLGNHRLGAALVQLGEGRMPHIVTAGDLSARLATIHSKVNQSLAWEGAGFKAERIAALDQQINDELRVVGEALSQAAGDTRFSDEDRALVQQAGTAYAQYADSARHALEIKTGMLGNAASFMTTMEASYGEATGLMARVVANQTQVATAEVAAARGLLAANRLAIGAAIAGALLAALVVSLVVARLIVRPLEAASRLASALAEGDLSQRVQVTAGADATGRVLVALQAVAGRMSGVVGHIRSSADRVNTASAEIASGTLDLSVRTEATAASLQQSAASMEQLSTTLRSSADHARQADAMAREAAVVAREGGSVMGQAVTAMGSIEAQARQIGDIVGTIDALAFQTNILALNAAVEAARAGEQGRGFSVVASEVRVLAQRSAAAAKQIRGLIGSSIERIDDGVTQVERAGATMGRIVEAIDMVSRMVGGIAEATSEQASGVSQVNTAIGEMDRNTQQNAAMVEQASAATVALRQQSAQLVSLLAHFKVAAEPHAGPPAAAPAHPGYSVVQP